MNNLQIASQYLDLILQKRKRTTIRLGRRPIVENETILLEDESGRRIYITVKKINVKTRADLNPDDALADGFPTVDEMLLNLNKIYPKSSNNDLFTIIEFDIESQRDILT